MPIASRDYARYTEDVRLAYAEEVWVASAARTASGDGGEFNEGYGEASSLRAQLEVTAASGTSPSLSVFVEDTLDGVNWNAVGTFAARTAVGREVISITTPFSRRLRVRWAITGTTPSFTFSVRAVVQGPSS